MLQTFYLIWQETLKAAKSSCGCLKGDKSMHLSCDFYTRACFPWQAVMALNLKNRLSQNFQCEIWIGFLKFSHN